MWLRVVEFYVAESRRNLCGCTWCPAYDGLCLMSLVSYKPSPYIPICNIYQLRYDFFWRNWIFYPVTSSLVLFKIEGYRMHST
jgi:hypothetical protein